jgi:hypothetical protein
MHCSATSVRPRWRGFSTCATNHSECSGNDQGFFVAATVAAGFAVVGVAWGFGAVAGSVATEALGCVGFVGALGVFGAVVALVELPGALSGLTRNLFGQAW